jgi:serine/threonine-protein kinase
MNLSPALDRDKDPGNQSSREAIRQHFVAAWENTVKGGAAPTIEAFLGSLAEPERSEIRTELEALDRSYREHSSRAEAPTGATGEYQPTGPGATGEYQAAGPGTTGEYLRAGPGEASGEYTTVAVSEAYQNVPVAAAPTILPRVVAGYEILGVLGRGAFGVVYKARQPGLKRVVALKMILGGGHADERELARFRAEAEAIARLQHPNIVQVYEVGEDDGQPFFSLEYVDGTSLKEKIAGTLLPPRECALLTRTLAEAMAHAHKHSIVHRDIKPANVLLTSDNVPKIGDFGLARRLEEDSGQTRTGSAVGTPSYMAPEQAEGRSREAGPLADVYSLGAVLYELLAGRAPFRGANILQTLEQVRLREPVAPTQLQPGVPRDLETICLKCLQKDPARRYTGADDLAEDLRRYLTGEPIKARPVSLPERAWRWCKRNPWVAGPIAAAVLALVGWGITSTALAMSLKRQKDATEEANRIALANEAEAKENERQAKANERQANINADEAKNKHELGIDITIDFVSGLFKQMKDKRLDARHGPELANLRRYMVDQLRQQMLRAVRTMDQRKVSNFGEVRSYQRLGDLMRDLGQGAEAMRLYRKGQEVGEHLRDKFPNSDVSRGNIGNILLAQAFVRLELDGDAQSALAAYNQARELFHEILARPRDERNPPLARRKFLLSLADCGLGMASVSLGDPAAACRYLDECRTLREEITRDNPRNLGFRSYLGQAHQWLGIVAWRLGDAGRMEQHFGKAVAIGEDVARLEPADFSLRRDLAEIYGFRGDAQMRLGTIEQAETSYKQALRHMQDLVKHDPNAVYPLPLLALTYERLAGLALRRGDRAEADKQYRTALALHDELMQIEPNNLAWRASHVLALARCGKHEEAAVSAEKLWKRAPRSTELLLQVARCFAVCAALDTPRKKMYTWKALDALREAVKEKYRDATALVTDPELGLLRQEAAYQSLLAAVKRRS